MCFDLYGWDTIYMFVINLKSRSDPIVGFKIARPRGLTARFMGFWIPLSRALDSKGSLATDD